MAGGGKEIDWRDALVEAVGVTQARGMVQHFILRDIVIALARAQPDPQAHVAAMFERVSALVDQCELSGTPGIEAEMRWYAESFFTMAGNTVAKP